MTAQRFHFPNGGPAPPVSPAFGALWDQTTGATRQVLGYYRTGTAIANRLRSETSASVIDCLGDQYVSEGLPAGPIISDFTLAVRCNTTDVTADGMLQARIALYSADGLTHRGDLYAGQTAVVVSSNPADPNFEMSSSASVRMLTGTLVPLVAQAGDILVVEYGTRFCNALTSSRNSNVQVGDVITGDLVGVVGDTNTGAGWIEFSEEVITRRRFYLPGSGSPAVNPTYGAQWEQTGQAVRTTLAELGSLTSPVSTPVSEVSASVVDVAAWQFTSTRELPGGLVDPGTFSIVLHGVEDPSGADAYLQCVLRVVSNDGATERWVMYAGQAFTTVSAVSTDPNFEFSSSAGLASPRIRQLTGFACTPGIAQPGDRLVLEVGPRFCNVSTSLMQAAVRAGSTSLGDLPTNNINGTDTTRPWIEFVQSPFLLQPPDEPINLATTPGYADNLLEWDAPATGPVPDGYRVRLDGGTPIDVGLVFSHLFTGLTADTEYDKEVQAYNNAGDSAWVLATDTTLAYPPLIEDFETGPDGDPITGSNTVFLWVTP